MEKLQILFHELPHSKPIKRFVKMNLERRLEKLIGNPLEAVTVEFYRLPMRHLVACTIEVREGAKFLRRMEYGKGIQNAFDLCLKRMSSHITPVTAEAS